MRIPIDYNVSSNYARECFDIYNEKSLTRTDIQVKKKPSADADALDKRRRKARLAVDKKPSVFKR